MLVSWTILGSSGGRIGSLEPEEGEFGAPESKLLLVAWFGLRVVEWLLWWSRVLLGDTRLLLCRWWLLYEDPEPGTLSRSGEAGLLIDGSREPLLEVPSCSWSLLWWCLTPPLLIPPIPPLLAFTKKFDVSSSMYVKSDSGRGPVWLRELRMLCKLCKLWTERRSSKSSRVDLNARITRSCKNRERAF